MRHGQTLWNEAGRYQGTADTSLSEIGQQQAVNYARCISDSGIPLDKLTLISSPLARAQQTSKIIVRELGLNTIKIITDKRLRELEIGRWQGLNSQQVKDQFYEERKSRKRDRWNFKPVGGESLEQRSSEVLELLLSISSNTLVVTHAGILRIIQHLIFTKHKQEAAALAIPHDKLLVWNGD